jgi:hypothetical protein
MELKEPRHSSGNAVPRTSLQTTWNTSGSETIMVSFDHSKVIIKYNDPYEFILNNTFCINSSK